MVVGSKNAVLRPVATVSEQLRTPKLPHLGTKKWSKNPANIDDSFFDQG